jgi:hypothetical protein
MAETLKGKNIEGTVSPLTGFHAAETGDPEDSFKSLLRRAVLS